jgi:cobalt-zinc-cadmium efflux system membrane fusion protein
MTMRVFLALLIALSFGLTAIAAAQDEHDDLEEGHDEHDIVQLKPAEIEEFGLEFTTAGPGIIEASLELPGEVRPNDDRLAHIVPRYSGIVTEVRVSIGDQVQKGQVLAVVENDESLTTFEVKTMISGTIIGKHVTLGEAASRDREMFVIADLSSVWIDLTVYQRDLDRVKVDQRAQVYVGHDMVQGTASINYVTPIVDEHTRTATARLVLTNRNNFWRPGMFVMAKVLIEKTEVPLVVPRTALHTFEGNTVVFLVTDEGFEPHSVVTGRSGETNIEILEGLSAGEKYVSRGGFTLKAELGKAAFGDAHAH